jgi:hypothetical protein
MSPTLPTGEELNSKLSGEFPTPSWRIATASPTSPLNQSHSFSADIDPSLQLPRTMSPTTGTHASRTDRTSLNQPNTHSNSPSPTTCSEKEDIQQFIALAASITSQQALLGHQLRTQQQLYQLQRQQQQQLAPQVTHMQLSSPAALFTCQPLQFRPLPHLHHYASQPLFPRAQSNALFDSAPNFTATPPNTSHSTFPLQHTPHATSAPAGAGTEGLSSAVQSIYKHPHGKVDPQNDDSPPGTFRTSPSDTVGRRPSLGTVSGSVSCTALVTGTGCGPILNGVRTKRGQGVSCHSCKTNKDTKSLFHCQNTREKGIKKRSCRKKVRQDPEIEETIRAKL